MNTYLRVVYFTDNRTHVPEASDYEIDSNWTSTFNAGHNSLRHLYILPNFSCGASEMRQNL